ncbi:polyprenyl synthetase family protein [Streptomyces sp. NPDC017940]|uniref:polyprenyl synthetase family protein n=1 Tax=Streptomyces sp. NPDC017940 TaxID=3365017 RepID=UPI003787A0E1
MRRTELKEHPSPGAPAHGRRVGDGGHDGDGFRSAEAVDADVVGAVEETLGAVLRGRAAEAAAVDPLFAEDIARRVVGFTLEGGKRIRPQFLWWGMRAAGGHTRATARAALRVAAAVELIQTCALIHDDVMDASPLRRGGPSVHADLEDQYPDPPAGRPAPAFGTSAAVLAGDLALAWADDVLAETVPAAPHRHRIQEIWRAMRTEMVAGQYLDLHSQANGSRSVARAVRIACLKSALYTVERPLALGAALAGADPGTAEALCAAGRSAGIAFQLRDDLVGVFGDPRASGKPCGEDIRDGKLTYLLAVATARAEARGDRSTLALLRRALGDPELSPELLDRVRAALVDTGARAAVESRIERLVSQGTRRLARAQAPPHVADRLARLFATAAGAGAPGPVDPAGPAGPAGPVGRAGPASRPAVAPVRDRAATVLGRGGTP